MKVLGMVDSFKGSISSEKIGRILKEELEKKNIECDYIPISDGGEGFLDMVECLEGNINRVYINTYDPLLRSIETYYLVSDDIAYLEYAKCCGVGLFKKSEYNPYYTSSYGFGVLLKDAINKGYKNIVIGIGGSITNDGGSGLLEALGVNFIDDKNERISRLCNERLKYIKSIAFSNFPKDIKVTVVSDVKNVILGKTGATYIFSPQKGAKFSDLEVLEENMTNYVQVVENVLGSKFRNTKGSGAAGGVGFALISFFKAKVVNGIDFLFKKIDIERLIKIYDYIITGEGKIDKTSLYGKVVFEILKKVNPKKVIVVCGKNELCDEILHKFKLEKYYQIVDYITTLENSLSNPEKYLRLLIKEIKFEKDSNNS